MALTGTEYLEFQPREPASGCVVDDRYIVTMGKGDEFAVFDTATQTSRAFTGIGADNRNNAHRCMEMGGYAWVSAVYGLTLA